MSMLRLGTYPLIVLSSTVLFWIFRENSFSGDWQAWIRYLEGGLWYRLREPISLVIYQIPYLALRSCGVSARDVLAATSCVMGGLSMSYAWAALGVLTSQTRFQVFGMLALLGSYGVSGVFFGHLEHYSIMSLGCFAYLYYALRYLRGDASIIGAALVLALTAATHLMAAWLVPSLLALPWIKPQREVAPNSRLRDFAAGVTSFGVPNLLIWAAILTLYYDANVLNLIQDGIDGRFSKRYYGVGNALGGGNDKGFLTLAEIFSGGHWKGMAALLLLYSPIAIAGITTALVRGGRDARDALLSPNGRLLLALTIPYSIYAWTWEPGLGYAQDWDLFSHLSIFLVFTMVLLVVELRRDAAVRVATGLGLLLSFALTGYVVAANHEARSPTGVWTVLSSAGVNVERISKIRIGPQ
ncbi:MAG: hypothetical protein VX681_15175 [Myxococcota bacterium]|nr:hypothetical protein [Myxococcota bacterium]